MHRPFKMKDRNEKQKNNKEKENSLYVRPTKIKLQKARCIIHNRYCPTGDCMCDNIFFFSRHISKCLCRVLICTSPPRILDCPTAPWSKSIFRGDDFSLKGLSDSQPSNKVTEGFLDRYHNNISSVVNKTNISVVHSAFSNGYGRG